MANFLFKHCHMTSIWHMRYDLKRSIASVSRPPEQLSRVINCFWIFESLRYVVTPLQFTADYYFGGFSRLCFRWFPLVNDKWHLDKRIFFQRPELFIGGSKREAVKEQFLSLFRKRIFLVLFITMSNGQSVILVGAGFLENLLIFHFLPPGSILHQAHWPIRLTYSRILGEVDSWERKVFPFITSHYITLPEHQWTVTWKVHKETGCKRSSIHVR